MPHCFLINVLEKPQYILWGFIIVLEFPIEVLLFPIDALDFPH